jgi:hypothetical protein
VKIAKTRPTAYRRVSGTIRPGRSCLSDGDMVTMSVDPLTGAGMISTWQALSAVTCADIRLSGLRRNSTVFAMYAISHEVKDRRTEPWWELDSSSWAGGWTPCGSTGTRRESRTQSQGSDLPHHGANTDTSASHGTSETRPASWSVDDETIERRWTTGRTLVDGVSHCG